MGDAALFENPLRRRIVAGAQDVPPPATGLADRPEERALAVAFKSDGTAEPLELRLADRDGYVFYLRINPITSRVTVVNEGRQPL